MLGLDRMRPVNIVTLTLLSSILLDTLAFASHENHSRLLSPLGGQQQPVNSSDLNIIHPVRDNSIDIDNGTLDSPPASMQTDEARFKRRLKSSSLPEFSAPIGNVTAVLGRDVRLICTVEHLGQYQVAWLRDDTILSIDTNIIITNYRIFLIPDEEERKWVLHIKDVQESDRGFYQCQVNTKPMKSIGGYLDVVVPPTIIESQTSQALEIIEHSNVNLHCKASGHPRPNISWRRDDGSPIKLYGNSNKDSTDNLNLRQSEFDSNRGVSSIGVMHLNEIKSDSLTLYDVDRTMAGIYICTASNGIPLHASKRIPVYIKFPPKTTISNRYISVIPGEQLEIDCMIEAYPKASTFWSRGPSSLSPKIDSTNRNWLMNVRRITDHNSSRSGFDEVTSMELDTFKLRKPHSRLDNARSVNGKRTYDFTSFSSTVNQDKGYPHHTINIRQVDGQPEVESQPASASDLSQAKLWTAESADTSANSASRDARGYVTVRQSALNSFTYKIKLVIAKMKLSDYGQYNCVSSNSLGSSESQVTVTRTEKGAPSSSVDGHSIVSETVPYVQSHHSQTYSSSQNRGVYDENYLKAIKLRLNNGGESARIQQKLKMKNSSCSIIIIPSNLMIVLLIVLSSALKFADLHL